MTHRAGGLPPRRYSTAPPGLRRINENAGLLSRKTGLHVSCCEGPIGGIPWGMEQVNFSADL